MEGRDAELRQALLGGTPYQELCKRYGLSRSRVYQIAGGYRLQGGVKVYAAGGASGGRPFAPGRDPRRFWDGRGRMKRPSRAMKSHWRALVHTGRDWHGGSLVHGIYSVRFRDDLTEVTCGRCLRMAAWRAGLRAGTPPQVIKDKLLEEGTP